MAHAFGAAIDVGLLLRVDPHRRVTAGAWRQLERIPQARR
jgi:hypothetical protein